AVQGIVLGGGCELALACDLVVMEEHAHLSFRQAAMGLSTGWGGGTRLIERVGQMAAARTLLLGASLPAREALALGLVTELVPTGDALARAEQMARAVAALPRSSIAGIKRMLCEVRRARRADALVREAEVFASLWGGPDHLKAMDAFFKRR
ncbi:MAG: enoyl-CoA hydratase-related protein, partial [Polyangiaceae bacterium]|nr:enoyl-CoA hydratase-related protein [Polyangiaceae bacterium]